MTLTIAFYLICEEISKMPVSTSEILYQFNIREPESRGFTAVKYCAVQPVYYC